MHIRYSQDFLSGLFFCGVAIGGIALSSRLDLGTPARMAAGFFPMWLSVVLLLLGAVVLFRSFFAASEPVGEVNARPLIAVLAGVVIFSRGRTMGLRARRRAPHRAGAARRRPLPADRGGSPGDRARRRVGFHLPLQPQAAAAFPAGLNRWSFCSNWRWGCRSRCSLPICSTPSSARCWARSSACCRASVRSRRFRFCFP